MVTNRENITKIYTFQKKKKKCGPIFNVEKDKQRIKYNKELKKDTRVPWIINHVKISRIEWYEHAIQKK